MDTRWDGLLVNARLVTLAGDAGYGVIEDGALGWHDGILVFAGHRTDLPAPPASLADELVVTEIDAAFDGDAHAPAIGPDWREVARERIVAASGLPLSFVIWHRLQRPTLSRPPEYQ